MSSIADKIIYLDGTKQAIKTAIEAKGGVIAPEDTFRSYAGKISEIPGYISEWARPSDWIDISQVNDNEINLLVGDFGLATTAFTVTTDGGVQYTVDWGDGNIISYNSGVTAQHTYAIGTGQACSFGYSTFKVVISCETGNILTWKIAKHNLSSQNQYSIILEFISGTIHLTDCSSMFYVSGMYSYNLIAIVLPETLNDCTATTYMCRNCISLQYVKFPTSMSSLLNMSNTFDGCTSISYVVLPTYTNVLTDLRNCFFGCTSLKSVVFPTNLDQVIYMSYICYQCYSLNSITLPNLLSVLDFAYAFLNCYSLKEISNIENLGSLTQDTIYYDTFSNDEAITTLTIYSRISSIGIAGQSGKLNKLESLRLTNQNSTFTGSSPQINCSYCNLEQAALVTLFGDLPVLVGKTINITGCTGAAALTAPERAIATDKGWTIIG